MLVLLENDFRNPSSIKSGEHLADMVLKHTKAIVANDRKSLVGALQEWIREESEPKTMLAVRVAKELGLVELRTEISELRNLVADGKVFPKFYLRYFDEALSNM